MHPPMEVKPITMERVMESFQNGAKNAGGMDNWLRAEAAMLTLPYYKVIADMYQLIEEGEDWPSSQTHGRLAFLEKDDANPEDPMAYTLLTLSTVLYRRWASIRLHDLAPWAQ